MSNIAGKAFAMNLVTPIRKLLVHGTYALDCTFAPPVIRGAWTYVHRCLLQFLECKTGVAVSFA
jgi:hypothetical protein